MNANAVSMSDRTNRCLKGDACISLITGGRANLMLEGPIPKFLFLVAKRSMSANAVSMWDSTFGCSSGDACISSSASLGGPVAETKNRTRQLCRFLRGKTHNLHSPQIIHRLQRSLSSEIDNQSQSSKYQLPTSPSIEVAGLQKMLDVHNSSHPTLLESCHIATIVIQVSGIGSLSTRNRLGRNDAAILFRVFLLGAQAEWGGLIVVLNPKNPTSNQKRQSSLRVLRAGHHPRNLTAPHPTECLIN